MAESHGGRAMYRFQPFLRFWGGWGLLTDFQSMLFQPFLRFWMPEVLKSPLPEEVVSTLLEILAPAA